MGSLRVRVTMTHAQAAAIAAVVAHADDHTFELTRGMTAVEVTRWGRAIASAKTGVGQIRAALRLQRERAAARAASPDPPVAQTYAARESMQRMADGRCPECGGYPREHDGWGGPNGCTLTDNGVAARLDQYRRSSEESG